MEMIWSNEIRQAKRDRLAVNRIEVCSLCWYDIKRNRKEHLKIATELSG